MKRFAADSISALRERLLTDAAFFWNVLGYLTVTTSGELIPQTSIYQKRNSCSQQKY
jgi:hypothetical protein